MNQDVNGNMELFWKEVIQKEYVEDICNIDSQEQVEVHVCKFDWVQRGNCFGGEKIRRTEVEVRVRKLKNGRNHRIADKMQK